MPLTQWLTVYLTLQLPLERQYNCRTCQAQRNLNPGLKPRKSNRQSKTVGSERLKTVVCRLPPNLPEQIFWQSVQTWATDESVILKESHPGKVKKK